MRPGSAAAPPRTGDRDVVVFDAVAKAFGQVRALDGASFRLERGETVALLGPNGAGKSTAISLMLGLRPPDAGEVLIYGEAPRRAVAGGRVGAMLQSTARQSGLPPGATVSELVTLVRSLYPRPLAAAAVMRMAGIEGLGDRPVDRLSGGESQRVRFAVSCAGDPELVFLDEPTVAMDVEARREFWQTIRTFAAEGRTILFATHYLEEADAVADRIVVLNRGRVVADGPSTDIKGTVAAKTVRFTLDAPDRDALGRLPGVTQVEVRGQDVTLRTVDADQTVRAVYQQDLPIRNIEVTGAGLEEAFLQLTQSPGNGAPPVGDGR